jgi:hypothetical protein
MKKGLIVISLALVLAMSFAIPAFAGGKGAVKGDLLDYNGVYGASADPVVVGSFNVNTTASGELRVVVNLSSAEEAANMDDLTIRVIIRQQSPCIPAQINTNFADAISTNQQGQGNAILKVSLPDVSGCNPMPTDIQVMVLVNPGGSPNLFEGAANLIVPLK